MTDRLEPTDDEARNGWTAERLAEYVARRQQAQLDAATYWPREVLKDVVIDGRRETRLTLVSRRGRKPETANGSYRPKRWRG